MKKLIKAAAVLTAAAFWEEPVLGYFSDTLKVKNHIPQKH